MAISNYSELQTSISDWLNRADLTAVIPDFIKLAEAMFNRKLRTHDMVKRATTSVEEDYFSVPTDWLETNVLVSNGTKTLPMTYVDYERLNELKGLSMTGQPRYYTMVDGKFLIYPAATSESPVSLELSYIGKIEALSNTNTTNWLLTKSPDLYLYGALMQAEPYLKNDERVGMWAAAVQTTLEDMRLEGERSKRPSGGLNANRRSFG